MLEGNRYKYVVAVWMDMTSILLYCWASFSRFSLVLPTSGAISLGLRDIKFPLVAERTGHETKRLLDRHRKYSR